MMRQIYKTAVPMLQMDIDAGDDMETDINNMLERLMIPLEDMETAGEISSAELSVDNINEISHLVDGYITVNGAYCFEEEEIISFHPIPEANVRKILSLADEMDFACMVVGKNDLVMYHDNESADRIFRQMLNVRGLSEDVSVESVLGQSVLQLTPIISQEDEELIMRSLPNCTSCRWHPDFADITMKSADKGMGLSAIIARHGIKPEETMAFGDGGNDMSIIKKAGIGVAMGNANEPLKNAADYITDSVDEDGIYKALKRWIFH